MPIRGSTRLIAMTGLLTLVIVFSALLAWQAVVSAREHRATAERALEDYADFAAFVLATGVYRDVGLEVLSWFNGMPPWNTPDAFAARVPLTSCDGSASYFEFEPATGRLRQQRTGFDDNAEVRLRDTLMYSAALLDEAGWRFRLIRLNLGESGEGVFIASSALPSGFGVRGFSTCLWRDSALVDLMRRAPALPASLTGNIPPDSLYAVSVGDSTGAQLYVSPVWYPPVFVGSSRLGPEFGDLELKVTLNPAIAPGLVIGGLPSSRLPSTVALFALSFLLLAAAAFQLRREHRLIAARSEFVSNVSHELRTPLSQILIFTELLKLKRLRSDAERARSLEIIDSETRRLIRLVENVLQFSSTPSSSDAIDDQLAVLPVVRETVDAFRPLADVKKVTIDVTVPAHFTVKANRNSLRQVLLNLLDNAVKYGPENQTVRIEAAKQNDRVELAVEDQGPGIPVPERGKIWDGFHRLDREARTPVSGSGIGLSVVKSLVDRMHGQTHVTDSLTGGARFVVSLPAGAEGRDVD